MVDLTELSQASALNDEKQGLLQAMSSLDAGAAILNMTVGMPASGGEDQATSPVTIATDDITYPPEMTTAIKAALQGKVDAADLVQETFLEAHRSGGARTKN